MDWEVVLYREATGEEPVQTFISVLPLQARQKVNAYLALLRQEGLNLKEPYTRAITGSRKLRELRVPAGRQAYRILYCGVTGRKLVLLHAFLEKTAHTPVQDIRRAERRMQQYLAQEEVQT